MTTETAEPDGSLRDQMVISAALLGAVLAVPFAAGNAVAGDLLHAVAFVGVGLLWLAAAFGYIVYKHQ